jgi:hypothetical protein
LVIAAVAAYSKSNSASARFVFTAKHEAQGIIFVDKTGQSEDKDAADCMSQFHNRLLKENRSASEFT